MDMDTSYEYAFDYAVCLYELKEYQKAKEIFIDLLKRYPDRMRLMLSISYCEACLGNKDKAKFYLQKVRQGKDDNYSLNTDDIFENEIFLLHIQSRHNIKTFCIGISRVKVERLYAFLISVKGTFQIQFVDCLLYTSDAADE